MTQLELLYEMRQEAAESGQVLAEVEARIEWIEATDKLRDSFIEAMLIQAPIFLSLWLCFFWTGLVMLALDRL